MLNRDDFGWFKKTFFTEIDEAVTGTPFSLDMLAAIAAQETGDIWGPLRNQLSVPELLEICVGDTLDASGGRSAFPKRKLDLLASPRGQEMFQIAHDALVNMAKHVAPYATVARNPSKFCHAFGIFQYDIQFFRTDPEYFLERQWRSFDSSLAKCIEELQSAMARMGIAGQTSLTDLEKVHVAIAYNAGTFNPVKGLKQGHFDGSRFYGEQVFDFLLLSQSAPTPSPASATHLVHS